ncbi:hypothetical protein F4777DRAFT_188468 [Nemania sp. FL0916]|nr:hypothetical protein F4777DRAFT_188468 [Nemania sp. FL0916]
MPCGTDTSAIRTISSGRGATWGLNPVPSVSHDVLVSSSVPVTVEVVTSVQVIPPQTVTRPLTTVFTPPASCSGRYYMELTSDHYYYDSQQFIFSGASDRVYRECQPGVDAYSNYYSPGMCPHNMDSVTVQSFSVGNSSEVIYTDICCQSGFVWNIGSCNSVISTTTMVLVAPAVSTRDLLTPICHAQAWHDPIKAAWQAADLSLFPPDVSSKRSSMIEHGISVTSATSTPSDGAGASQEGDNRPPRLSHRAVIGIAIGASLTFVLLSGSIGFHIWRRRKQLKSKEARRISSGAPRSYLGHTWRIEAGSPSPGQLEAERRQVAHDGQHEQREGEQAPAASDNGPAEAPARRT